MKKILMLMMSALFIFSVFGCGDGDSDPVDIYTMTDNTLNRYDGGETLQYDFSYDSHYSDGNDLIYLEGLEATYFDIGDYIVDPYMTVKSVTVMYSNYQNGATAKHFYYNENNDLYHYTTNSKNTNYEAFNLGQLLIPGTLNEGYSWTNNSIYVEFDNIEYGGTQSFIVANKEFVDVPFGRVETYRIDYTGSFRSLGDIHHGSFTVSGTFWVNTDIGIIKTIENMETLGIPRHYIYYKSKLSNINWSLEE